MKRRHFIRAVTSSLALPVALKSPPVIALSASPREPDCAFFDNRFEHAHRIAVTWAAANRLVAVQGDITPTWQGGLQRLARTQPLTLRGVTTESFHFCLKVLLGEPADVDMQVSRVDRNLFVWTMRTVPKFT